MIKLKKILVALIIAVMLLTNMSIYAYTGDIDTHDNIQISDISTKGTGEIKLSRDVGEGYKVYYQWIEISNNLYKQIKKLKDELQIIEYVNMYEETEEEEYYNDFLSAQEYYKEQYGAYLEDYTNQKVNDNITKINNLLPEYTNIWTQATNNTYKIDLTTFSGKRDCVLWVLLEKKDGTKVYDTEIFELKGEKEENNNLGNDIQISNISTNGRGTIEVSRNVAGGYKLYYQWIEISNNLYKQIKKLKDELQIIEYANMYEETKEEKYYDDFLSAQEYYKEQYGAYLEDYTNQKVNDNITKINDLLPKYTNVWEQSIHNVYDIDLTKFSGKRDYALWVQLEKNDGTKIYDTEIFELTGQKREDNSEVVDEGNNVHILPITTRGTGEIEVSRNVENGYKLYYQWVEINNDLYKQIKKLKDELQIIEYVNMYEETKEEEYYEDFLSAQEYYKEQYGAYLEDYTNQKVNDNITKINNLLPEYTNTWTQTTDNTYKIDLTTFLGKRDYVLWVQLEKNDGTKIYDTEIFELTGQKREDNSEIVDEGNNVHILPITTKGTGEIEVSRNVENGYKLYYQWIEINNDLYKQIKKLKDELQIIEYVNMYEETKEEEYYEDFLSAQEYYKEQYGAYLEDYTNQRVNDNITKINNLLPKYTNTWTQTTDNTYKIDLTTFLGKRDYVLWVQLEKNNGTKVYAAEIFELTGNKKVGEDNPGEDKPGEDKPGEDKPGEDKPGEDKPGEDKPGEDKPGEDKPGEDKPGEDKPGEDKPGEDKPGEDKPGEDKPGEDKPGEDKPGEDKPGEDKPGNDKPEDDNKKQDQNGTNNITNTTNQNTERTSKPSSNTENKTISQKSLPYAGITNGIMIGSILGLITIAIVTFTKYKKIK